MEEFRSELSRKGFDCAIASVQDQPLRQLAEEAPDMVLVEIDSHSIDSTLELSRKMKRERRLAIIALVDKETIHNLDGEPVIDDFVVSPCDVAELVVRANRLLQKASYTEGSEQIRYGDLMIDLAKCEVYVAGRPVVLTFREYELLRFLLSNKGRVFSREALLDKVWGYDYYGGDRTVDVCMRRLRSKIEDFDHTFIETVRNIGYKFRDDL